MPDLPTYVCLRTPEPIIIDGRLDEPVWSHLGPVGDFLLNDGSGEPPLDSPGGAGARGGMELGGGDPELAEGPQLPTELKMCWDDYNLYLAFIAIDTDIWGTYRKRDDPVWEEEVVEAFISSGGDVTRYFEFNFSPHNVVFDARIEIPENGDRAHMKSDIAWNCQGLQSAVQVAGTLDQHDDLDDRWTVEAALPFSQIGRDACPPAVGRGRPPADGERWRANFYRIDRAGEGEFSSWSPTLVPNFHVPARFGHLVFSHQTCEAAGGADPRRPS